MLPVTVECLTKLKGAAVIPVGVATQHSINEKGDRITKRRTTHDASFPSPSNNSISNRLLCDLLTECIYGHCLLRYLHIIHIMRFTKPNIRIFQMKLDLEAANDILADDTFDPSAIHSPLKSTLAPPNESYPSDTMFGIARRLFVDVPFRHAAADGYIDDIITAMLDTGSWIQKGSNAALLAVHTLFRRTSDSDPLPRPDAASIRKLIGEGTPDEIKIIVGWVVNTRLFRIFLPIEKAN